MPKTTLQDVSVVIDSYDVSDHANHVELSSEWDAVDVTTYGMADRSFIPGATRQGAMSFRIYQDFVTGNANTYGTDVIDATEILDVGSAPSIDGLLQTIHAVRLTVPVLVKPTSAAITATNPAFGIYGLLAKYAPLDTAMGDALAIDVEFTGALTELQSQSAADTFIASCPAPY